MSFSSAIGILLGMVIIFVSIIETGMDPKFFLNFHGIVIVLGGTFCVGAITYPIPKLFSLIKIFFLRVIGKQQTNYQGSIELFLELNKKVSIGTVSLNEAVPGIRHEFMKEAVGLVASGILTEREIRTTLEHRIVTTEEQLMHDAKIFQMLGRFPPAFGLLATTLGMIALLQIVGQPGSEKLIGPAMSIGLVGTFYGITLANFFFLPIAEALVTRAEEEVALRKMMVEGAILLKSQVNPIMMRESLNSFVLPKDRVTRKVAA